jgi:hypothetical protein
MSGYLHGLTNTGCAPVDRILSAVRAAGDGYHHTDGWSEPSDGGDGPSCIDRINAAAKAAADAFRAPPLAAPAHRVGTVHDDGTVSPATPPAAPAAVTVTEAMVEAACRTDPFYVHAARRAPNGNAVRLKRMVMEPAIQAALAAAASAERGE